LHAHSEAAKSDASAKRDVQQGSNPQLVDTHAHTYTLIMHDFIADEHPFAYSQWLISLMRKFQPNEKKIVISFA
jgi:hypothetical protein